MFVDGPMTQRVPPPSEQEFVDIFQKIKYSLCLLVRWQIWQVLLNLAFHPSKWEVFNFLSSYCFAVLFGCLGSRAQITYLRIS